MVLKSGVPATVFTGHQEEGPFMALSAYPEVLRVTEL